MTDDREWCSLRIVTSTTDHVIVSAAVPPAGANRGRYANPVADRLIETAEASPDLAARAAIYRQLQEMLALDLPFLPLWFEDFVIVRRARVLGYDTNASGDFDALARVTLEEPR